MKCETSVVNEKLFTEITKGNVILFLGAGASVTSDKIYLSKHLIEYYRDMKGISYEAEGGDIVDFVDKVFSVDTFDRDDFDYNIAEWLRKKLKVEDHHKALINLPWLSIITTNVDLLIENTIEEEELEDKFQVIRNRGEFKKTSNLGDKVKYIKLHGCISDTSKYPLVFSSLDFASINKYYKNVFNALLDLSLNVKILFIGYSFSDKFGELFLNKFSNKLKGREFYVVDPFIKDDEFNLSYLSTKNIIPIKTSIQDFINDYSSWFNEVNEFKGNAKVNLFKNLSGANIPQYLQHKLRSFIIPINKTYNSKRIEAKDFYLGEEPNFNVIQSNFDVIKQDKIDEVKDKIFELFKKNEISYPFVFLTGSYGTGKTTFTYRLIHQLIEETSNLLAFEITNLEKVSSKLIIELINNLKETQRIIFYSNHSELDLNFKKIRELRGVISSQQFTDKSIIFLQSIRENALARFKKDLKPKIHEINIDSELSDNELEFLLEKFNYYNVKKYRSELEKKEIIRDLKFNLKLKDQLLVSLYLINNGSHESHIIDTYKNFKNDTTKKAFLFTALLYQYGIRMPVSLLREIIDKEWKVFIEEVVKIDGKGIFIQEESKPDYFLKPDLFFKIKHRIIAERFISSYIKDRDLFNYYKVLITSLPENVTSVNTFINLIKSLISDKKFDGAKINHLYDLAYKKLSDFVRFNIYYSRNLQFRKTKKDIEKGLTILKQSEYDNNQFGFKRDSKIIHRKACLNIELSKMYYLEDNFSLSKEYFDEAYELFEIKLAIDPNTIFSYKDFIYSLSWYLTKWELSELDKIKTEIKISNLVNTGISNLQEGLNDLFKIRDKFVNKELSSSVALSERIDKLIGNLETKPYALLLRYEMIKRFPDKVIGYDEEELIEQLEFYSYIEEIAIFLFHYFAKRLSDYSFRMKYYKLIKDNNFLIKKEELHYLYYNFMAEAYSFRFRDAFEAQRKLHRIYRNAIRKEIFYWKDENNVDNRVFEGKIFKGNNGYYGFKISNMGHRFLAKIDNKKYDFTKINLDTRSVHLYFTYTGIWADII